MRKIIMRLHLPVPEIRKRAVRAVQKHKDKAKYTRKCKHKAAELRWPYVLERETGFEPATFSLGS